MTVLILARHGETDWNRDGIWQGHGDPPLNGAGRAQARELAGRLANVELAAIYSSDLRRALETATIVAGPREANVVIEPGLREIDAGSWTGLTRAQIDERFPGLAWCPDAEPREAFQLRATATVQRVAASHPAARVLLVTHGGVVRAIHRAATGEPLAYPQNCELWQFGYEGGTFTRLD